MAWTKRKLEALPIEDIDPASPLHMYRDTFKDGTDDDFIEIDVTFISLTETGDKRDFVPIGPWQSSIEAMGGRFNDALKDKVKGYDTHDKPMMLVLVPHLDFVRRYDIETAIYGRELGAKGPALSGFFTNPAHNTRFSGVYVLRGLTYLGRPAV